MHCSVLITLLLCIGGTIGERCTAPNLARYRVTFRGHWSRERFPSQYWPEYRPHAQWSTLIGRTHDETFKLWSIDRQASDGFSLYVTTGNTQILDRESVQGFNGLFDTFYGRAIGDSEGHESADFLISNTHPLVSVATKMHPSPDWFAGIDSVNLCSDDRWIQSFDADLRPVDAGVDAGFMYTSPNFPSYPRQMMTEITRRFPRDSVFYDEDAEDERLPPIATVHIELLEDFQEGRHYKRVSHLLDIDSTEKLFGSMNKEMLRMYDAPPDVSHRQNYVRQQQRQHSDDEPARDQPVDSQRHRSHRRRHREEQRCEYSEWSQWNSCNIMCKHTRRREPNVGSSRECSKHERMHEQQRCSQRDCDRAVGLI